MFMEADLFRLIVQYQEAIARLFPPVMSHLGICQPINCIEWTQIKANQRGQTQEGIRYFIHGFGVEMDDGNTIVDFDLGFQGQQNGFDAWRLAKFANDNRISTPFNLYPKIKQALIQAASRGEIKYSGYILYYFNADCRICTQISENSKYNRRI